MFQRQVPMTDLMMFHGKGRQCRHQRHPSTCATTKLLTKEFNRMRVSQLQSNTGGLIQDEVHPAPSTQSNNDRLVFSGSLCRLGEVEFKGPQAWFSCNIN